MARRIEQYFRSLPRAHVLRATGRVWNPPADVLRTRDGWMVVVELAGVSDEEIEIEVEGINLRLAGSRIDGYCSETVECHQLEITYSRFEKSIRFPCPIESATVEREYEKGLLILRLRESESCG